jgi:hypothetical protein
VAGIRASLPEGIVRSIEASQIEKESVCPLNA